MRLATKEGPILQLAQPESARLRASIVWMGKALTKNHGSQLITAVNVMLLLWEGIQRYFVIGYSGNLYSPTCHAALQNIPALLQKTGDINS